MEGGQREGSEAHIDGDKGVRTQSLYDTISMPSFEVFGILFLRAIRGCNSFCSEEGNEKASSCAAEELVIELIWSILYSPSRSSSSDEFITSLVIVVMVNGATPGTATLAAIFGTLFGFPPAATAGGTL